MSAPIELAPDKVYEIKDFLTEELITKIRTHGKESSLTGTNLTMWADDIVHTSGVILLYRIEGELLSEIEAYIKTKVDFGIDEYVIGMTYTLGCRYSYIPWHNDDNHILAITVYLNDFWDPSWGGALIYHLDERFTAVYPEYNKAVVFKTPRHHCTVMPTIEAPIRESLQIFVDIK